MLSRLRFQRLSIFESSRVSWLYGFLLASSVSWELTDTDTWLCATNICSTSCSCYELFTSVVLVLFFIFSEEVRFDERLVSFTRFVFSCFIVTETMLETLFQQMAIKN